MYITFILIFLTTATISFLWQRKAGFNPNFSFFIIVLVFFLDLVLIGVIGETPEQIKPMKMCAMLIFVGAVIGVVVAENTDLLKKTRN